MTKYSVQQQPVETLLTWIKSGEIAIPEIQRPFVWNSTKVRDLLDSLYKGFPIGYIIIWKNPDIKTKDGKSSEGKKILIDGQQRISALTAAVHGHPVLNKNYVAETITIAFHPLEKRFEVQNTAIKKDPAWIKDVGPVVTNQIRTTSLIREYLSNNPNVNAADVEDSIEELKSIHSKPIGIIELNSNLDIDTVTTIFIRINSKGVSLSQADFVMSKIASDEKNDGNLIRKTIDYFCHMYNDPTFLGIISKNDKDFSNTEDFKAIKWIAKSDDDLYYPGYEDILRVAFTFKFNRGKFSDLVSLLTGRNFEKKIFEQEIATRSFKLLKEGVLDFVNKTHYERFVMIIQSIGFIDYSFITSYGALNFSYALYLKFKDAGIPANKIETYVKKWFVFSVLKGRYSGSAETTIDFDIKQIDSKGMDAFLDSIEKSELSDAFWNVGLIQDLESSNVNNPGFVVFLAQQINQNKRGFLSKDITVRDMIQHRGDLHHVYPKEILKRLGLSKSKYNQVANLTYTQQEINIKISKKSPEEYMEIITEQCETKKAKLGNICDPKDVIKNLKENALPLNLGSFTVDDYEKFLNERKKLMANDIRKFYENL